MSETEEQTPWVLARSQTIRVLDELLAYTIRSKQYELTALNLRYRESDVMVIVKRWSKAGSEVAFVTARTATEAIALAFVMQKDGLLHWRPDRFQSNVVNK